MSKRSHRFRVTVDLPEYGPVVVRGLSPDALVRLGTGVVSEADRAAALAVATPDDPPSAFVQVLSAGCVRPLLSEEDVRALSPSSRELLNTAIMTAHPVTRVMFNRAQREGDAA